MCTIIWEKQYWWDMHSNPTNDNYSRDIHDKSLCPLFHQSLHNTVKSFPKCHCFADIKKPRLSSLQTGIPIGILKEFWWGLSNFTMGTISGMGFAQAQVHTNHSTSERILFAATKQWQIHDYQHVYGHSLKLNCNPLLTIFLKTLDTTNTKFWLCNSRLCGLLNIIGW